MYCSEYGELLRSCYIGAAMLSIITNLFSGNEQELNKARKIVAKINQLEPEIQALSYEQMQERISKVRQQLKELDAKIPDQEKTSLRRIERTKKLSDVEIKIHNLLWEFMPQMYAMVREVMHREFNRRHFDTQLLAGVILAQGQRLTELKTGEGKTQVFQLPLFLFALAGRGAHLITVNDYLARRDGEYAGMVADKLGLTVGVITPGGAAYKVINAEKVRELKGEADYQEIMSIEQPGMADLKGLRLLPVEKKLSYECDITVGVNNEFGFDYLRDNMAVTGTQLVQRELYFCVVDEADSVLIDEARTPLIISALPEDSDVGLYTRFAKIANKMVEGEDYTVDHKQNRSIVMTEAGLEKAEKALNVENLWADYKLVHHLENAVKAKAIYAKDDEYIVRDGEVLIVDTFTGRIMPGRRFSEGIHQALEAKEGVTVQQENLTMATITFQNYFRLYKWLVGGSGTIMTEAEEFYKIYNLESVEVPTHRKIIRQDMPDFIYRNEEVKFRAVAQEIKERHEKGQPVLVGTTSVAKSELLSNYLDSLGVPHEVLNAKYHDREAQIVAQAGKLGAVTVATNMAGRGTDIPLAPEVKELGGLAVLGTERHEARRIDNQLRGRSGRQGDPGYTRFYVSLEDQIMKIIGGDLMERMIGRLMQDDAPIQLRLISNNIESAQKRIEGYNFDARKNVVDYDDVLNKHREVFYSRRYKLLKLTDDADKDTAEAEEAKASLVQNTIEMFKDEVAFVVNKYAPSGSKLTNEEDIKDLVAQILDFAPDTHIADLFGISRSADLATELGNRFRGKKAEKIREELDEMVTKAVTQKAEELGRDFGQALKVIGLEAMNRQWMEHLEIMSDIRQGIGLQQHAQRDPLTEYKTVGFQRFTMLLDAITTRITRSLLKLTTVAKTAPQLPQIITNEAEVSDILTGDREFIAGQKPDKLSAVLSRAANSIQKQQAAAQAAGGVKATQVKGEKVGRNDLCPCGSGKKYKNCGLENTAEHQANMAKL